VADAIAENLLQMLTAGLGPTRSVSYCKIAAAISGEAAVLLNCSLGKF
jgi:hypothetical protein